NTGPGKKEGYPQGMFLRKGSSGSFIFLYFKLFVAPIYTKLLTQFCEYFGIAYAIPRIFAHSLMLARKNAEGEI
ncbi:MAG: hypothetical protein KKE04_02070, partial [Candidatus Thermoplasmatota archaeon]|nr:hypothetical protein [Candidatus Thermoplasmatota archaeon]